MSSCASISEGQYAMLPLELKVPPLALMVAFGTGMYGLSLVAPTLTIPLVQSTVIACTLIVVGASISLAGVIAFRARGTTVSPTTPEKSSAIVSKGIYRFTRNPMYLGFALALAGLATYLSNAASLLVLPAFVAYMNKFQIKPEERVLLSKFGTQFSEYMSTVRRWI
jgi:protein-S-isoprenylcysteine O-methyltransferase Ste14